MATANLPVVQSPENNNNLPAAPGETSSSAIAAREKAAIEARFLMALHRPRDFDTSRLRLLKSCERHKFAAVARYAKPVGRDKVTGLSIRFAEEARVLWGNMDVTTLLVFDDDMRRIYRVQGIDLETNATEAIDVMVEKFVERRQVREGMEVMGSRQNTSGQTVYKIRATEDDLIVKANALVSKARRNTILSLLPGDLKEECEAAIIETLKNRDAKDPDGARKDITEAFFAMGVMPQQLAELLGHPLEQLNPAELTLLRSYYTALKDGEATWSAIVEAHGGGAPKPAAANPAAGKGADALKQTLGAKKPTAAAATTSAPATFSKTLPDICEECGATGGNHKPDCRFFAD